MLRFARRVQLSVYGTINYISVGLPSLFPPFFYTSRGRFSGSRPRSLLQTASGVKTVSMTMRMRMSSLLRPRCCPDHLSDGINDAMASYSPKRMEGKCREGGGWVGNKCAKIWQTRGRVEEKIIISKAVSQMRMTNFMVGGSMHSPLMFCSQPRRSCQPTAAFSGAQT